MKTETSDIFGNAIADVIDAFQDAYMKQRGRDLSKFEVSEAINRHVSEACRATETKAVRLALVSIAAVAIAAIESFDRGGK